MEILAVIIFVVIVFTIAFIAYAYHWLSKKQGRYFNAIVPEPIIRTYNMEELSHSFIYTKERERNFLTFDPKTPFMPADRLIHEKKRVAEKFGRTLLENGFIEVKERSYPHNPFMNEVEMRLKVFKDGAVSESRQRGMDESDYYSSDYVNESVIP